MMTNSTHNNNKVPSNTSTTTTTKTISTRSTPKEGFSLNYLGKIQRKRIEEHLEAGKTLKCHHRNCKSFINNEEFTTLYDYNIHCYNSNHANQPIHPEIPLIEMLNMEPRGNPWEEVVENDTYLPLGSSKSDRELLKKYYNIVEEGDQDQHLDQMDLEEYT